MRQLLVDFITSLEGCASAEGWPGLWGMGGPEYLGWLDEAPERDWTVLMGATTYRLFAGFAVSGEEELGELDRARKVVFSSTLSEPLAWANTELVTTGPIEAVRSMKADGDRDLRTIGSLTLCRTLLEAGLVDRFRVVVFPVVTGRSGSERIYEGWPDVGLELVDSKLFDGRLQLLEYAPTVLAGPPA